MTGDMMMNKSMPRLMNIFAAVALATSLAPIAANAAARTPLDYVRIAAHSAMSGPQPEVQHVAVSYGQTGQSIVQSGTVNQRYPDSAGG
jgi:poly(3-hydroxybutyrate) depolymerase